RQAPADGLEEEVLVRAETSAEDDERDVGDGADRRDVEGDPARDLVDDLARDAVAAACLCEERARVVRRRQAACCGEPLGEGRDSGGRGIELGVEAAQGEVDLSGGAV